MEVLRFCEEIDKRGADSRFWDYLEADFFFIEDIFDNIEPYAKAPFVHILSIVAIEDLLGIFDTDAVVLDGEDHFVPTLFEIDFDLGVLFGILDSVGKSVVDDTLELRFVDDYRRMSADLIDEFDIA